MRSSGRPGDRERVSKGGSVSLLLTLGLDGSEDEIERSDCLFAM